MDRRKSPRYDINDRVCITLLSADKGDTRSETFFCNTHDLSAEGLGFTGNASFKPGQILDLLVVRGSAYRGFSLKAKVVRVEPQHDDPEKCMVGLEFIDLPEQTRLAWTEAIEREAENRPLPTG